MQISSLNNCATLQQTVVRGLRRPRLLYAYDNSDNMTGITDSVVPARSTTYGYDPVDRLSRIDGNLAGGMGREDLTHDANGNRLHVQRRVNASDANPSETISYTKTPTTNRLASVTSPAGTRSISYDARGNTTSETRPGGVSVTASYDGHGRLTAYAQGTTSLANIYNSPRVAPKRDDAALNHPAPWRSFKLLLTTPSCTTIL